MTIPDSPRAPALDALVAQAQAAVNAGNSTTAMATARAALRLAPDHDPALEAAWHASMLAARWDWALLVGQRWSEAHPQELGAWQARLLPQLLLHQTEAFATSLRNARQVLAPHTLLSVLEALFQALTGDDAGSAASAAPVSAAEQRRFVTALLGPTAAGLLETGWQPALLRALLLYEQQMACIWAGRPALGATLTRLCQLQRLPWQALRFIALGFGSDEDTQVALANRMADDWPAAGATRAPVPAWPAEAAAGPPSIDTRLRVGYLSRRLGAHATVVLMGDLPVAQDHARFQLFAYGFSPGQQHDAGALRVRGCEVVRALPGDAAQSAAVIAGDAIDVLIVMPDWDMNWLAAVCRASGVPVVVSYLSFCGSTGGLAHYRIVDDSYLRTDPPPREATIHLRGSCYPYSATAAPARATRHEHGLPDSALVVAAFNAAYKIGPDLAEVWARLLRQVPGAVLWLHQTHALQAVQLRAWFAERGVGAERLVFAANAAHPDHLARSALADLYLDAWDYNGHTTILDALYAGVPVVTLEGTRIARRIGASLLREHGAQAWVASSPSEYEQLALRLMQSAAERAAYRAQLAESRAQFMPFQLATQALRLDAAISAAYARYQQGLPPADITIG